MRTLKACCSVIVCAAILWASGIAPAIIPQAVPVANKIGNSTKFQLGATGAISGDCATFDASLNITGPGTGVGCGVSGTAGGGLTVYSGTAGIALSGTVFFPVGGGSQASATETTVDADISASTTISRFGANISTALGGGNSVAFTWRKNASSQTLTCTISNSNTNCADTVNSFSVVPGDLVAIQAVFTGTIVVAPTFVLTAQVGTLLSGNVNSGTQFQIGEYTGAGTTTAVSGVSIPNCTDTGGNHVNFTAATGVFTCGTSGGGGGTTWTSGTYAGLPGTCTAGSSYLITNSPITQAICTATNVYTFSGGFGVVSPPQLQTWTDDNVGTAVFTYTNGDGNVAAPLTTSTQLRVQFRAAPATPYTATGMFSGQFALSGTLWGLLILFRDGTGKISTIRLGNGSIENDKWNSSSSFNSDYNLNNNTIHKTPVWLRIGDNGTNLTYSYSADGQTFTVLGSPISRTDFFGSGPTQIGWGVYVNTADVTTSLLSFMIQ
jgi:hypothetical protein